MFATAEDNPSSAHYNIGCKPDDEDTVADVDHPENKHERSRTLAHIREIEKFQNVAVLPDCASLPVWNFGLCPLFSLHYIVADRLSDSRRTITLQRARLRWVADHVAT